MGSFDVKKKIDLNTKRTIVQKLHAILLHGLTMMATISPHMIPDCW